MPNRGVLSLALLILVFLPGHEALASQAQGMSNPIWLESRGQAYRVGITLNDETLATEYVVRLPDGQPAALADPDLRNLAWHYEMALVIGREGQLRPLLQYLESTADVVKQHYTIIGLAKFRDYLVKSGVALTAAYFGDTTTAAKLLGKTLLSEVKGQILNAPKRIALDMGRINMAVAMDRMAMLISYAESRERGLGQRQSMPLPLEEVRNRYMDWVWIDVYLEPSMEMVISLQGATSALGQFNEVLGVVFGDALSYAPGPDVEMIQYLLDMDNVMGALTASVVEFEKFHSAAKARLELWRQRDTGDGEHAPGLAVPPGLPPGIDRLMDSTGLTIARAIEVLPFAELSVAVYDAAIPEGSDWRVLDQKRNSLSGFHAQAYSRAPDMIVVAFEGSGLLRDWVGKGSIQDWLNNLAHANPLGNVPMQYREGLEYVENLIAANPNAKIILTGHSLGGGIAQYVGASLELDAVVFNAAGLWWSTLKDLPRKGSRGNVISRIVTEGYIVDGYLDVVKRQDIVASLGIGLGSLETVRVVSPGGISGYLQRHGIHALRDAIKAISLAGHREFAADLRIATVVDSSGSMRQTDPRGLRKAALQMMIDRLNETAMLAIVDFNSRAKVLTELVTLGPMQGKVRQSLFELAAGIGEGGGTNIRAGLQSAADLLTPVQGQSMIILLTDGIDNSWSGESDSIPRDVPVHAVALSDEADTAGLERLTSDTGGILEIARTSEDLHRIFSNFFNQAQSDEVLLVRDDSLAQGEEKQYTVYVDSGHGLLTVQVSWQGSNIDLVLEDPRGVQYSTASAVRQGIGLERDTYDIISLPQPIPGLWRITVQGVELPESGETFSLRVTGAASETRVRWIVGMPQPETGGSLSITIEDGGGIAWSKAMVRTWDPTGMYREEVVHLGGMPLLSAGGQVRVVSIVPKVAGNYRFQINAEGTNQEGVTVQRSLDRSLYVATVAQGQGYHRKMLDFIR